MISGKVSTKSASSEMGYDFRSGGGGLPSPATITGHVGRVRLQMQHFSESKAGRSNTWFEKDHGIIPSPNPLLNVVRSKNLPARWNLDENATVVKLSRMIFAKVEPGTDLFNIEVFSPDANEAAELANAVADAYENTRRNLDSTTSQKVVGGMLQELEGQEKRVEEKRVEMLEKMKKYNIVDFGGVHSTFSEMTGPVDDGRDVSYKQMASRMAEYENETAKLKSQLKALSEIQNQDQLIEQASAMNLEGPSFKEILPKYHTAKLELDNAKASGLNDKHPKVVALKGQVEDLKKLVNESVRALRKSLETKAELAEASLASLKNLVQNGQDAAKRKEGDVDYLMKKREYEQSFALLNEMREEVLKQRVDSQMPMSPVQRHEAAYPNPEVVKREVYSDVGEVAPYTGKTVRIAPAMPQPLFAGTPLPVSTATAGAALPSPIDTQKEQAAADESKKQLLKKVDELWETAIPKIAGEAKSGLIPLEITLPESGQTYVFSGNHLPSPITLNFTTWRRELQIGWLFILMGGVAAWVLAKRHPIFVGILVGLILHFTPELLGSALQKACNGLLFGWTVTCVLIWITRKFHHRFSGSPQPAQP